MGSIWENHNNNSGNRDSSNSSGNDGGSSGGSSGGGTFNEAHYAGISDLLSRMKAIVDDMEYIVGKTKTILEKVFK